MRKEGGKASARWHDGREGEKEGIARTGSSHMREEGNERERRKRAKGTRQRRAGAT